MKHKSKLPILYEDDYLIAVNKPPRIASVPAPHITLIETILGQLQKKCLERGFTPYLLHRLDFHTSGVLLFGKHERNRQILESIFHHPQTRKKYIALIKGIPRGSVITKSLRARTVDSKIPSQTFYKVIKIFRGGGPLCALVEAEIKTGRKHQIRKHFASIGCPIVLDLLYGDSRFNRKFRLRYRLGRLFLHAASLEFLHPFLEKEIKIEAPLFPDLQSVIKKLQLG